MEKKIGFIGLGNMGSHMAKNLIEAGYHLQVYNRTLSKIDELPQASVTVCKTPAEAAANVPALISMLSEDEIVKEAVSGADGILKTFPKNAVHISMSTIGPDTSEELAKTACCCRKQLHRLAGIWPPGSCRREEAFYLRIRRCWRKRDSNTYIGMLRAAHC